MLSLTDENGPSSEDPGDLEADSALPEPIPVEVERDLPKRLVIIGDLNGHARLLDNLLIGSGLIDEAGSWTGGTSVLVQMGDVVNRGLGARAAADRLIRLRQEARAAGGEVLWLLGNHEVMTALQHEAYVTAEEYLEFARPSEVERFFEGRTRRLYELLGPTKVAHRVAPIGGRLQAWEEDHAPGKEAFRKAFSEEGIYGRHIRSLPVAIRVGPLLFVHGGLSPHWASLGLEGLAAQARVEWARKPLGYHGLDPNGVFRDPLGPLWHRAYCVSEAAVLEEDAADTLDQLGVSRMIVGHTRTESVLGGVLGRPLLRQGGRVMMTDVGIGEPGEPGCAVIVEDGRIDGWSPIGGHFSVCALAR